MYVNGVRRLEMVGVEYRILTRILVEVVVRLFVRLSLSEQFAGSIRAYIPLVLQSTVRGRRKFLKLDQRFLRSPAFPRQSAA
jgi:hypothetical protein